MNHYEYYLEVNTLILGRVCKNGFHINHLFEKKEKSYEIKPDK